jgi:cobalt-precorrin 5A hydrolase
MIVAGIGCKRGTRERDVMNAVVQALAAHGMMIDRLSALATGEIKRDERAIGEAARHYGVPLIVVDDRALTMASDACLTHSEASIEHAGVASLCEAAAIAAAGRGARLLGPRIVVDGVTCAVAQSGALE